MHSAPKLNICCELSFFLSILLIGISTGLSCSNPDPTKAVSEQNDIHFGENKTIEENLLLAIGNTDIAVGTNRMIFAIIDKINGPIIHDEVKVNYYYIGSTTTLEFQVSAKFVKWPMSNKGVYVSHASFDKAGRWGISVITPNGTHDVQAGIIVKDQSDTLSVGTPVPASINKTSKDVSDLSELTTSPIPSPQLYKLTIAEAINNGRPTVLTFATPAFCSTTTCGPQVEIISSLSTLYKNSVNFIHIEIYEHPNNISGNPYGANLSPIVMEWNIKTEPFTFVIDNRGVLKYKYEGFVTEEELVESIDKIAAY